MLDGEGHAASEVVHQAGLDKVPKGFDAYCSTHCDYKFCGSGRNAVMFALEDQTVYDAV